VEVNLTTLEDNARAIRRAIPQPVELMAILKADGYGHGTVMLIPTLVSAGVSMVGVASMDEAIQIREAGLDIPVLVIGPVPDWAIQVASEYDVQVTIFGDNHLQSIKNAFQLTPKPIQVHIKVDTGMHRIGVPWQQANAFIDHCHTLESLEVEGVFSHLACAEDPSVTALQLDRFQTVLNRLDHLPRYVHLANSAGALLYHNLDERINLARIGIALLGYLPQLSESTSLTSETALKNEIQTVDKHPTLNPVMGLKARIVHLHQLGPGEGLSYHHTFHAPSDKPLTIATLPLGYADGIFRGLSHQLEGLLKGQRVVQVGNITMDQLMVDVTDVDDPHIGDTVTLLGHSGNETITLTDWAKRLNTLEYELMCALRVRLPKVYTR